MPGVVSGRDGIHEVVAALQVAQLATERARSCGMKFEQMRRFSGSSRLGGACSVGDCHAIDAAVDLRTFVGSIGTNGNKGNDRHNDNQSRVTMVRKVARLVEIEL